MLLQGKTVHKPSLANLCGPHGSGVQENVSGSDHYQENCVAFIDSFREFLSL